jgi:hypothetical protein
MKRLLGCAAGALAALALGIGCATGSGATAGAASGASSAAGLASKLGLSESVVQAAMSATNSYMGQHPHTTAADKDAAVQAGAAAAGNQATAEGKPMTETQTQGLVEALKKL